MTVEIKSDVGAEDANSYVDLEEAEAYFELRSPAAPNWSAETNDDAKSRALITATRLIDQMVFWYGEIASATQALFWPRTGLYDSKGFVLGADELPDELKWAVCEYAESLLVTDRTADLSTQGIDSLSVGSISINFSSGAPPERNVLPDIVWDLISRWGDRRDSSSGVATIVRA